MHPAHMDSHKIQRSAAHAPRCHSLLRRWLTRWGRSFTHTEMAHVARVVTLVAQWRHLPGSPGLLRQPVPCVAKVAIPPVMSPQSTHGRQSVLKSPAQRTSIGTACDMVQAQSERWAADLAASMLGGLSQMPARQVSPSLSPVFLFPLTLRSSTPQPINPPTPQLKTPQHLNHSTYRPLSHEPLNTSTPQRRMIDIVLF